MPAVFHPFWSDIALLHQVDGSVVPTVGEPFGRDGGAFVDVGAWAVQSFDVQASGAGGGGSNVLYSIAPTLAYDIGAGDQTLECRVFWKAAPTSAVSPYVLAVRNADSIVELAFLVDSSGYTVQRPFAGGFPTSTATFVTPVVGQWTHLALTRKGNIWRAFVNGVQCLQQTDAFRAPAGVKSVFVGNLGRSSDRACNALFDEVCLTKRCLYEAAFTPPDGPYTQFFAPSPACQAWPAGARFR